MTTITDRLIERGHTVTGGVCEKCWADAYMRSMEDTSKSQSDHYADTITEAEARADDRTLDTIEEAVNTVVGRYATRPIPLARRMIAAETLRACARELRAELDEA